MFKAKGEILKKLHRSRKDQKLAGVIGGLGEYLEMDSNVLRLLTILVCLFTGIVPVLITYIIAWAILPFPTEEES